MGANAATKLLRVVSNVERVIAIECFAASQALFLREPLKTSSVLQEFLNNFRKTVEFVEDDIIMYQRMDNALNVIKN
jgi:histidine ammonia-lyase